MYIKDARALNDFGELKYITQAKNKIEWYDVEEPGVILKKYEAGQPLRAIAADHARSIDQLRDFAAKLKSGIVTPPTHFATMEGDTIEPDYEVISLYKEVFRDGTPQHRASVLYKVPGIHCMICPTTSRFYSEIPTPEHLEGDALGLEGDTFYTTPCGTISAAAAIKRTFWDRKTRHSLMLFNPQVISNIFPWCRSFSERSVEFAKCLTGLSPIFEDLFYIDAQDKLQSFYPDVVSPCEGGFKITVKTRGSVEKLLITDAQVASRAMLRKLYDI